MFRTEIWPHSREENQPGPVFEKSNHHSDYCGSNASTTTPRQSRNQGDDEHHQEDEEQELSDSGRRNRDPTEPENRGNNRDNQKYERPIKHAASSLLGHVTSIQTRSYPQAPRLAIRPTLYFKMQFAVG